MDAGEVEGGLDGLFDWTDGAHNPRTSASTISALCFMITDFR